MNESSAEISSHDPEEVKPQGETETGPRKVVLAASDLRSRNGEDATRKLIIKFNPNDTSGATIESVKTLKDHYKDLKMIGPDDYFTIVDSQQFRFTGSSYVGENVTTTILYRKGNPEDYDMEKHKMYDYAEVNISQISSEELCQLLELMPAQEDIDMGSRHGYRIFNPPGSKVT